jgi:hypothetical protein
MAKRYTPRKASTVLDLIGRFLVEHQNDGEAEKLWDVLSATRGPDSQSYIEKTSVTIPIRRAAFPQVVRAGLDVPGASFGHNDSYPFTEQSVAYGHFKTHALEAARALRNMGRMQ